MVEATITNGKLSYVADNIFLSDKGELFVLTSYAEGQYHLKRLSYAYKTSP